MRRTIWIWGPALLQMAAIFFASSLPNLKELPGGISDKTGHFVGYAMLGAFALRGFARGRWAGVTGGTGLRAWLFSAAYGGSDEFHQRFVPGRSSSALDWVADILGALAAVLVVWAAAALLRRGRKTRAV